MPAASQTISTEFVSMPEFLDVCTDIGLLSPRSSKLIQFFGKNRLPSQTGTDLRDDYCCYFRKLKDSLAIKPDPQCSFSNYITSIENFEAVELLRDAVHSRNTCPAQRILLLGKVGIGKTHLLMAVAQAVQGSSVFLNGADLACQLNHTTRSVERSRLLNWILKYPFICLDDLHHLCQEVTMRGFAAQLIRGAGERNRTLIMTVLEESRCHEIVSIPSGGKTLTYHRRTIQMLDFPARYSLFLEYFKRNGYKPPRRIVKILADKIVSDVRSMISTAKQILSVVILQSNYSNSSPKLMEQMVEQVLEGNPESGLPNGHFTDGILVEDPFNSPAAGTGLDAGHFLTLLDKAQSIETIREILISAAAARISQLAETSSELNTGKPLMNLIQMLQNGETPDHRYCITS